MIEKIPTETETFMFHNENPKGHRTGDCVIRAIAAAEGKTWDEVFTSLCELALKYKEMPNDKKVYSRYLEAQGWKKYKQPRKDDNTKYTGSQWCIKMSVVNPDGAAGNVIAHIGGHHIVCIKPTNHGDGINCRYKICDTWDSSRGCIGNYWIK